VRFYFLSTPPSGRLVVGESVVGEACQFDWCKFSEAGSPMLDFFSFMKSHIRHMRIGSVCSSTNSSSVRFLVAVDDLLLHIAFRGNTSFLSLYSRQILVLPQTNRDKGLSLQDTCLLNNRKEHTVVYAIGNSFCEKSSISLSFFPPPHYTRRQIYTTYINHKLSKSTISSVSNNCKEQDPQDNPERLLSHSLKPIE